MNYTHFPAGGTRPVSLYLPLLVVHTLGVSLVIILTYFRARASCRHSPLTFIEALSAKLLALLEEFLVECNNKKTQYCYHTAIKTGTCLVVRPFCRLISSVIR